MFNITIKFINRPKFDKVNSVNNLGVRKVDQENQETSQPEDLTAIKEKLSDVNKKLRTLEWDKKMNQLNTGMEERYAILKEQQMSLLKKVNGEA